MLLSLRDIPSAAIALIVAKDPPHNAIGLGKEAINLSADNLTSQVKCEKVACATEPVPAKALSTRRSGDRTCSSMVEESIPSLP